MKDKEEIKKLIEKYLNDEATLSEQARIDSWVESDSELYDWLSDRIETADDYLSAEVRERLGRLLRRTKEGSMVAAESGSASKTTSDTGNSGKNSGKSRLLKGSWRLWVGAAVVVVVALVGGVMLMRGGEEPRQQPFIVRTNAGERSTVTLPDGTTLTLNHLSEIQYCYEPKTHQRRLTLHGEAVFDVKTDPEHPFVVECGGLNVECRGTQFNVKGYADEETVTVVLMEGAVRASANDDAVDMQPGDKVSYDRFSRRLSTTQVEAADYSDWARGGYRFNDERLEEILRSVSRHYDVKINLITPSLQEVRLSGSLDKKSLEETLRIISAAAGAKYRVLPDSTICFYKE